MMENIIKKGGRDQTAHQTAIALLKKIPASLPYQDWFRVAAALKNSEVAFEVFDKWSQTAPNKYNSDAARKVWDNAAADGKPEITIGTLYHIAKECSTFVPAPLEMLPCPTKDELPKQAVDFLRIMFRTGESFELVLETGTNEKGKKFPKRSRDQILTLPNEPEIDAIVPSIQSCTTGAWVSINPVSLDITGNAPADSDVTDCRYALIEADDLSQDEQWQQLRELHLPVLAVVWSGGKSLHTIVKIDAGDAPALYRKRVNKLYEYLKTKNFPADSANKNPSRITRIPGVLRGDDMQYLVSGSWGYPDWQSFEKTELAPRTNSPASSQKSMLTMEDEQLICNYGFPYSLTQSGSVSALNQSFFAAYTIQTQQIIYSDGYFWKYNPTTGLWQQVVGTQMNNLIAASTREFGKRYNVDLSSHITAPFCRSIKSFIEPEQADPFKKHLRYIHVANGMVFFSEDGTATMQAFAPKFYSRNRCEIAYDPNAKCSRFIDELLQPALPEDDIELLQLYCGQCLLGDNLTQKILVLTGTAGGGKGTIVNIIEHIIGLNNCVEMRTKQLGERFETAKFIGKSLLIGSDVPSDFLLKKDAGYIKSLCGHDRLTAELKGQIETIPLEGRFNIIITANNRLKMNIDGDADAWARRVIWIPFERPRTQKPINDFAQILLNEEGCGILNWMIAGACKVLKNGIHLSQMAQGRIDKILHESNSVYGFVTSKLKKDGQHYITADKLYDAYKDFCVQNDWLPLPQRQASAELRDNIQNLFQISQSHDLKCCGRSARGYHGLCLQKNVDLAVPPGNGIVPFVTGNLLKASHPGILAPETNATIYLDNVINLKQPELF